MISDGGFQNLAEGFEVAPMRPAQRLFARCLQQDHLMVYSSAVQIQLEVKPCILSFEPLRVLEPLKGDEPAFWSVVLN